MKNDKNIKSIFKINLALLVFFFLMFINVNAQDPNWNVNENEYEYTMTFIAFLTIDGERLESPNDKVGLFVGDVCRGTAALTYDSNTDSYFAFPAAFANVSGEEMSVKIYNSTTNEVRNVNTTVTFAINGHNGDLFQAVSWADPELSNEAEFLDFSFQGINPLDQSTENRNITIILENEVDISALIPEFQASKNAEVFINTIAQATGAKILDFSNPVTYQVRSQDQSIVNEWIVTVLQIENDLLYRKKNAVCYQNGAIKVSSSQNGNVANLLVNGKEIDSQTFVNNEVVFEDLVAGDYEVQIGNVIKAITINLKTN